MPRAFEQVSWPDAGCDSEGGLWVAFRTFPTEEKPEPPSFEIMLANSWQGLDLKAVSMGPYLSPPVLAIGREDGQDLVTVAWTEGAGGFNGIRSATASRLKVSEDRRGPETSPGAGIAKLRASADATGRVWLAWQEMKGRTSTIRVSYREAGRWTPPQDVSGRDSASSAPTMAADPEGGMWLCWCQRVGEGFLPMLRHRTAAGFWEEPLPACTGDSLNLDPSIDVDADGKVILVWKRVVQRWGTFEGYRLGAETQLYARAYDPETQQWFELTDSPDAPIPIPGAVRFMPLAGGENLEHWAGPTSPRAFIDAEGGIHVLFRRYRDVHAVYDWGYDLCHTTWNGRRWNDVALMSHTAGYPDEQFSPVRMADGGAALVYQFSNFAPLYWHCQGGEARPPTNVTHSGAAIIRLPWGGKIPWFGRPTPTATEARQAGKVNLSGANRLDTAAPSPSTSETVTAKTEAPGSRLSRERCFFGDLHRHSELSTACMPNKDGSLWDHYRWARDLGGLDFYALTDHVEESVPVYWSENLSVADAFNQTSAFVALYGMEYTSQVGAEVGLRGLDLCLFMSDRDAAWKVWHHLRKGLAGEDLLQELRSPDMRGRVILARHFHGGRGYGVDLDEPSSRLFEKAGSDIEPVLEIVQHRGPASNVVTKLLMTGQRKGVIGGSDHGRPSGQTYAMGITGVWAEELSRESIFSAIQRRRSFATNGPRMVVDFTAAGAPMGSEVKADDTVELRGFVEGTAPLKSFIIYRDAQSWQQIAVESSHAEFSLRDQPGPGSHYYWIYATQEPEGGGAIDGELWSSAVWVTVV